MDRFGIDTILSFEDRVNTVAAMCKRGHADKMVLSHDAACFNHWLPERPLMAILPRWHYLHIHYDVIPALEQKGVTPEQLRTMLVENPRRIFEQQGTYNKAPAGKPGRFTPFSPARSGGATARGSCP
jgi:phosphotriesterase-related protein